MCNIAEGLHLQLMEVRCQTAADPMCPRRGRRRGRGRQIRCHGPCPRSPRRCSMAQTCCPSEALCQRGTALHLKQEGPVPQTRPSCSKTHGMQARPEFLHLSKVLSASQYGSALHTYRREPSFCGTSNTGHYQTPEPSIAVHQLLQVLCGKSGIQEGMGNTGRPLGSTGEERIEERLTFTCILKVTAPVREASPRPVLKPT